MVPPTLLLTRPAASSVAFVASLAPDAVAQVCVVACPLMEIAATGAVPDLSQAQGVIFTSANGVAHAPPGAGRVAHCVGQQTTAAATARGWQAYQAGSTARDLVQHLSATPPAGPLVHLSGVHTRGDIAAALGDAGIATTCVVVYDQRLLALDAAARGALRGLCILPVFSPRTALQLVAQAADELGQAHIIALSDAVAHPFNGKKTRQLTVLPAPQTIYMRREVENLCRNLRLP